MGRLNFDVDEASLLKAYKMSSLNPRKWEEVDHDIEDTVAGSLAKSSTASGDGDGDPLGLGASINLKEMDMESKAAVVISSKSFDPKAFLSAVHPNATYQDLASGISHLKTSIDSRSEAIRILVEENFDKFVAVKSSTDAVYGQMKDGLLAPSSEYGSKPLRDHLKAATVKADQVFLPVLENSSKAQKLRTTLGVFERSKFFFNLPSFIFESVEAGRYEAALRDYKKGKVLLETRPGQLLPIGNVKDGQASASAEQQQKRILEKVWNSVEKSMGEMRKMLLSQLQDTSRSVEEHEKTIEILLELNANDDPVWSYFDSHHKSMLNQMNKAYRSAVTVVRTNLENKSPNLVEPNSLDLLLAGQLRLLVEGLASNQPETYTVASDDHEVWQSVLEMAKSVSEVMLTSLPNFWRVSKRFLDGKFKKPNTTSRRSSSQVRTMALDVVKLYISLLSEFFVLSDIAVMASHRGSHSTYPPLLPRYSNSFTTASYLMKILGEFQDSVNELSGMEISNEVASLLKNFLDSTKWRFEDLLMGSWLRDAKIFHHLEDWSPSPEGPSATLYLTHVELFQRHITTAAFKIAGGVDLSSNSSTMKAAKQNVIPAAFVSKIMKAFLDVIYAFLDGLVHLASDEYPVHRHQHNIAESGSATGQRSQSLLDLNNCDIRLLLVISNFGYLAKTLIPSMLTQLESAFSVSVTEDRQTLLSVVQELDKTLFNGYVKPKAEVVKALVRTGILESNMDWDETPQPTEIRPYMFEILIFLVGVHAQVSSAAEPLLERTLCALVDELVEEAFRCFRQVKRFGMGGMLRATLEIEFMHQTLSRYVTPTAAKSLSDLYKKISQAYSRRPGDENLQSNLDGVKKTLADTRRATGIEFLCFRQTKEKTSGSSRTGTTSSRKERDGRSVKDSKESL